MRWGAVRLGWGRAGWGGVASGTVAWVEGGQARWAEPGPGSRSGPGPGPGPGSGPGSGSLSGPGPGPGPGSGPGSGSLSGPGPGSGSGSLSGPGPGRSLTIRRVSRQIAQLEPELQGGFQCTPRGNSFSVWHWIKAQKVRTSSTHTHMEHTRTLPPSLPPSLSISPSLSLSLSLSVSLCLSVSHTQPLPASPLTHTNTHTAPASLLAPHTRTHAQSLPACLTHTRTHTYTAHTVHIRMLVQHVQQKKNVPAFEKHFGMCPLPARDT